MDRLIREKPAVSKVSAKKETETAGTALLEKDQEPFDKFKFQDVLEEIFYDFKENHKNMEISVLRQPYKIHDNKVVFFLNGEIQKEIFSRIRPEITGLVRKSLQNFKVDLAYEIKEDTENPTKRLYTSTDKLNYLREKSPALKDLQKRFGLETDF